MSSLALMRWLESAPLRYDAGMRVVTLGRVDALHDAVAEAAVAHATVAEATAAGATVAGAAVAEATAAGHGGRVLEIGCGTGAVTERLVARGARVTALDQNPEMLERARARVDGRADGADVEWLERTASEIDALEPGAFDAVVASLCLSEMSRDERAFVLRQARARLRPGGRLVVADEVGPIAPASRLLVALLRLPQAAAGWLLAGSVSRPLRDAPGEITAAGFDITDRRDWLAGSLAVFVARPREAAEQRP